MIEMNQEERFAWAQHVQEMLYREEEHNSAHCSHTPKYYWYPAPRSLLRRKHARCNSQSQCESFTRRK